LTAKLKILINVSQHGKKKKKKITELDPPPVKLDPPTNFEKLNNNPPRNFGTPGLTQSSVTLQQQ